MADTSGHSNEITGGIRIRVAAQFVPEQSDTDNGLHFFVYRILMSNEGEEWAQLISRRWVITDSFGEKEVVEGPGVVGEYPALDPGDKYSYISFCPMKTSWGTMEGEYIFSRTGGEEFKVQIGRFYLARTTSPISAMSG